MVDPVVAWDKLSNFETAQEIREYFQQEDVFGYRMALASCPIANWMKQTTGAGLVQVGNDISVHSGILDTESTNIGTFEHTQATLDFIELFDDGDYPELNYEKLGGYKHEGFKS